jgi:type IV secretory pathway TraG/TraD family ATPase VirD4
MMIAIQSLSQLDALYGKYKADTLRNNMDSQIFYRQASQETAEYLQRCLGNRSGFAHSTTEHGGEQTSQGQVEQAVALMTAQAIKQLGDTDIIGFHRHLPPFRAHRMDWRRFPLLVKRQRIPPPRLPLLPPLGEGLSETSSSGTEPLSSWRYDSALLRWGRHIYATYEGENKV